MADADRIGLLALAVARGFLSAEAAWQAAHVDEDFQAERWGEDTEAVARREARWREFEAAAVLTVRRRD
jgi:chaperone required for assembly of F1-ATPase